MGGAERGGRGDDGAPDTAGARRGGAVPTWPSQPRTRRLLPEQREPPQLRAAAAAGLSAPAASPALSPQLFPLASLFQLSLHLSLCSPRSSCPHPVFSQLRFLYPELPSFFLFSLLFLVRISS